MQTIARRLTAATAATVVVAAGILAPAIAHATPVLSHDGPHPCAVETGEMSWGVKESFRAYLTSSIAHGGWEVSDDMAYETPVFIWNNPVGGIDPELGEGSVSFTGAINFSAHDGVLDTTLENPVIEVLGDGTGRLLLDAKSNDPDGNLQLEEVGIYFAKIEGIEAATSGTEYAFDAASVVLTADGAGAFGGFYQSGDELDPLNLSVQLGDCSASGEGVGSDGAGEAGDGVARDADSDATGEDDLIDTPIAAEMNVPWLPIGLGAAAAVVVAVGIGILISGRKKAGASGGSVGDRAR